MLWVVTADKGSPGVTTTALALAAGVPDSEVAPSPLLVEADPGGGDLECWCGPLGEPGLLPAVNEVRERAGADRLRSYAATVVAGVDAIVAPCRALPAGAALRAAGEGFAAALAATDGTVLVDAGRWLPAVPSLLDAAVRSADGVLVVCRPTLAAIEHAGSVVDAVGPFASRVVVAMVGGDRPYGPKDVSAALGADVVGVLPWDSRGVATLVGRGRSQAFRRTALGIAATSVVEALELLATGDWAGRRG